MEGVITQLPLSRVGRDRAVWTKHRIHQNPERAATLTPHVGLQRWVLRTPHGTMPKNITLPKGTIVKLHGIPCELQADTVIYSATIEGYDSLEAFEEAWGDPYKGQPVVVGGSSHQESPSTT